MLIEVMRADVLTAATPVERFPELICDGRQCGVVRRRHNEIEVVIGDHAASS